MEIGNGLGSGKEVSQGKGFGATGTNEELFAMNYVMFNPFGFQVGPIG
jgi:hypothetical protein